MIFCSLTKKKFYVIFLSVPQSVLYPFLALFSLSHSLSVSPTSIEFCLSLLFLATVLYSQSFVYLFQSHLFSLQFYLNQLIIFTLNNGVNQIKDGHYSRSLVQMYSMIHKIILQFIVSCACFVCLRYAVTVIDLEFIFEEA